MIRAYGSTNEVLPPVVLLDGTSSNSAFGSNTIGSPFVTVEFDIQSSNIPNVYARLIHCSADWVEDQNGFLNDVTNRSSLVDWVLAPQRSTYFNYRGKMQFPNHQTSFRFTGNWKVLVYDMSNDVLLGETRIFVVKERASIQMNTLTDFYEPKRQVSSTALTLEAIVRGNPGDIMDNLLHTVTMYRNNRWNQPFIISQKYSDEFNPPMTSSIVSGMSVGGKVFRISRIPAENEYRVLDLNNLAQYPSTGAPVRMPFSDLRRNGQFLYRADDGALITSGVSNSNDEYIPIEFLMDPAPQGPTNEDVFLSGSFNQWQPDRNWLMSYDEEQRLYRLRAWVRRGRHNYMYATGVLNADNGLVEDISYETFEGNTASNSNSFIAFAYYRELDYGSYDGLVAVTSTNIYQSGR